MPAPARYLICHYYLVPVRPSITQVPNWQSKPENVRYDEQITFDFKIRTADNSANLILDLKEKEIVTNKLDPKLTYEQAYDYFYKAYKSHIDQVVAGLNQES